MARSKPSREHLRAHCGEVHDDDGVDPRDFFRNPSNSPKPNRKAKQLCRQVAETLDLVLSGESRDELLQALQVVSVEPAPDSSRLLVTVRADLPDEPFDPAAVLARLNQQVGRLRSEVAASIHRKRVPTLIFRVVPPDSQEVSG